MTARMRQVAWVTGASSGIGEALALELARTGWHVAATARNGDALARLAAQAGGVFAIPADVTDRAAMAAAIERIESEIGPVSLAVLNAGIYLPMEAPALNVDKFELTLRTNIMGAVHALAPLLPRMIGRRHGQIAIVASVTGYGGLPTSAAYGASKAALINLAETLAIELHRHNIKVTLINPGFIDTTATRQNPFPMPFLMPVAAAARRIVKGLRTDAFEIMFPRRFTWMLKVLGLLPARQRLSIIRKMTKWDTRDAPQS